MPNVAYVLGAGFSKQVGFPITAEFTSGQTISESDTNPHMEQLTMN